MIESRNRLSGTGAKAGNLDSIVNTRKRAAALFQQSIQRQNAGGLSVSGKKQEIKTQLELTKIIELTTNELQHFADATKDVIEAEIELAAAQKERSEAEKEAVRSIVEDLVVGGPEQRFNIAKSMFNVAKAFNTGTLQNQTPEDRSTTISMLDKFEDIVISGAGMTGGELKDKLIESDARRMGIDPALAKALFNPVDTQKLLVSSTDRLTKVMDRVADAMLNTNAINSGLSNSVAGRVNYKAEGGSIFQPKGTDTVPAMLTPGEFVIRKSAVDKVGVGALNSINQGKPIYRAQGGVVGLKGAFHTDFMNGVRSDKDYLKGGSRKNANVLKTADSSGLGEFNSDKILSAKKVWDATGETEDGFINILGENSKRKGYWGDVAKVRRLRMVQDRERAKVPFLGAWKGYRKLIADSESMAGGHVDNSLIDDNLLSKITSEEFPGQSYNALDDKKKNTYDVPKPYWNSFGFQSPGKEDLTDKGRVLSLAKQQTQKEANKEGFNEDKNKLQSRLAKYSQDVLLKAFNQKEVDAGYIAKARADAQADKDIINARVKARKAAEKAALANQEANRPGRGTTTNAPDKPEAKTEEAKVKATEQKAVDAIKAVKGEEMKRGLPDPTTVGKSEVKVKATEQKAVDAIKTVKGKETKIGLPDIPTPTTVDEKHGLKGLLQYRFGSEIKTIDADLSSVYSRKPVDENEPALKTAQFKYWSKEQKKIMEASLEVDRIVSWKNEGKDVESTNDRLTEYMKNRPDGFEMQEPLNVENESGNKEHYNKYGKLLNFGKFSGHAKYIRSYQDTRGNWLAEWTTFDREKREEVVHAAYRQKIDPTGSGYDKAAREFIKQQEIIRTNKTNGEALPPTLLAALNLETLPKTESLVDGNQQALPEDLSMEAQPLAQGGFAPARNQQGQRGQGKKFLHTQGKILDRMIHAAFRSGDAKKGVSWPSNDRSYSGTGDPSRDYPLYAWNVLSRQPSNKVGHLLLPKGRMLKDRFKSPKGGNLVDSSNGLDSRYAVNWAKRVKARWRGPLGGTEMTNKGIKGKRGGRLFGGNWGGSGHGMTKKDIIKGEFSLDDPSHSPNPFYFNSGGGASLNGGMDTIPAMLTPGEFVMSREAVARHGVGNMKNLNTGKATGFRSGGAVGGTQYKVLGGEVSGDGGMMIDASKLSEALNGFSAAFSKQMTTITGSLNGIANKLETIAASFQTISMNHFFTGDLSMSVNISNKEAIMSAVSAGLMPQISDLIMHHIEAAANTFKS